MSMEISLEGKISITLALLALGGGSAMYLFPGVPILGWVLLGISAIGFILLAHYHSQPRGRKMISLLGMIICTLGLIGFAAWHFWPSSKEAIEAPPPARTMPSGVSVSVSPQTSRREFTSKTARQLLALYEGLTPFQADKLIEPFKGLWIKTDSQVLTILPDGDGSGRSIVVLKDGKDTIECRFGPQWSNIVGRLSIGDKMSVQGKISSNQNGSQLYLLECEPL